MSDLGIKLCGLTSTKPTHYLLDYDNKVNAYENYIT